MRGHRLHTVCILETGQLNTDILFNRSCVQEVFNQLLHIIINVKRIRSIYLHPAPLRQLTQCLLDGCLVQE